MAANLTVEIGLVDSASSQANQITQSLTKMGAAGDQAAQQISGAGTKMDSGFRAASTGATQAAASASQAGTKIKQAMEQVRDVSGFERFSGALHEGTRGLTMFTRGVDDMMMGMGMGRGGQIAFFARGLADIAVAIGRMGPAAALAGGVIAGLIITTKLLEDAFKAVERAIKAAFSAGMQQEKLSIQMTSMLGSTKAVHAEIEQLKNFVTGGGAGFLSFDDLEKGVERLQMATGGVMSLADAEQILAGANAASGLSAERLGEEIGKVSNYMLSGQSIRYGMLEQLVNLRAITSQNAVELENMSKKGASGHAVFAQFEQDLQRNNQRAKEASNTFEGLWKRLQEIVQLRLTDPLGEALTKGLAPAVRTLDEMFNSPAIKEGIASFAYNLEVQLLTVFFLVKDKGFVGAFKVGVDEIGKYFKDQAPSWAKAFWDAWENYREKTLIPGLREDLRQEFQGGGGPGSSDIHWDRLLNLLGFPTGSSLVAGLLPSAGSPTPMGAQLGEAQKQNTEQLKAQTDKTTALNESTRTVNQTITTLNGTMLSLNNAVMQTGAQASIWQPGAGVGGGRGMFPGASVGLSEWAPGERQTHDVMFGPLGPLKMGDIALSQDKMVELFGSVSNALGKFVDIVDQNGNILLAHQRVWDVSFKSPGVPNVNTFEVWGRTWDQAGKVVAANMTDLERAQAQARALAGQQPGGAQPSALTGPGQLDNTRAVTQAMKQLEQEIQAVDTQWGDYEKRTRLVNDEEKNGLISTAQAVQQKIAMDKQMESQIDATIAKTTAMEAAFKKAYPDATEEASKYENELTKLHEKHDQIAEDLQKLQGNAGNFWADMQQGAQQAINKWGTWDEQVQQLSGTITDQLASGIGSAMTGLVTGTQKVSDAFKSMLTSMVNAIMDFLAKQAVQQLFSLLGSAFSSGSAGVPAMSSAQGGAFFGNPSMLPVGPGYQSGGLVAGRSGPDQVASMLTSGEYVMRTEAVDRYGIALFDMLNARKFASGGFVGSATSPNNIPPSQNNQPGTGAQSIAIITNVSVAGGQAGTPPGVTTTGASGGLSTQQLSQFQAVLTNQIKATIAAEKRPGGLLSKQQLTV